MSKVDFPALLQQLSYQDQQLRDAFPSHGDYVINPGLYFKNVWQTPPDNPYLAAWRSGMERFYRGRGVGWSTVLDQQLERERELRSKNIEAMFVHEEHLAGRPLYDWDQLRETIRKSGGIRNVSMMARMPQEHEVISQVMSGTSPGIYPVRELSLKRIKTGENITATEASLSEMYISRKRQAVQFKKPFNLKKQDKPMTAETNLNMIPMADEQFKSTVMGMTLFPTDLDAVSATVGGYLNNISTNGDGVDIDHEGNAVLTFSGTISWDVLAGLAHLLSSNQKMLDRMVQVRRNPEFDQDTGSMTPNAATLAAIEEARHMPPTRFASGEALINDLEANLHHVGMSSVAVDTVNLPDVRTVDTASSLIDHMQNEIREKGEFNMKNLFDPLDQPTGAIRHATEADDIETDESGLEREFTGDEDDIPGTEGGWIIVLSNTREVIDFKNSFQFQGEYAMENERNESFELEIWNKSDHNTFVTQILDEIGLNAFYDGVVPALVRE